MIDINERRRMKQQKKEDDIERTKDDVTAAANRFAMKQMNGVATQDDLYECLAAIGMARAERMKIINSK